MTAVVSNLGTSKKFFLFISFAFLSVFWVSLLLFLFCPKLFYWRAWEYFDEIVYARYYMGPKTWQGYEKGDLSRIFPCFFQKKWKTVVSADEDGFRKVPIQKETYPILIIGDSNTWGFGLSDEETFPWKVANKLQVPIYNAGRRGQLEHILAKENLIGTKCIVEVLSHQNLRSTSFLNGFHLQHFKPLKREGRKLSPLKSKCKMFCKIFSKDPRRYFLPFKVNRIMTLEQAYAALVKRKKLNECGVKPNGYRFTFHDEEMKALTEEVIKRSNDIKALGYEYVFVPLPPKALIASDEMDLETLQSMKKLSQVLVEKGIAVLDITTPFSQSLERKELFLTTDLHMGPKGAHLVSELISDYLAKTFPQLIAENRVEVN